MNNSYYIFYRKSWEALDLESNTYYGGSLEFYRDVIKIINDSALLSGYTFFLSEMMPEALPEYGEKVVLIVLSDEHYSYKPYFENIRCIMRSYGAFPQYKDGFPTSKEALYSFFGYIYKLTRCFYSMLWSSWKNKNILYFNVASKILHIPLAPFLKFNQAPTNVLSRDIDVAFLGSIDYNHGKNTIFHRFLTPPKLSSRRKMLIYINNFMRRYSYNVELFTTNDLSESIKNHERYINVMANCKISVCPRGSNYETYRYFESLKLGCVVICESLPSVYFYKNHPGLVVRNWRYLPEILDRLLSNDALLTEMSASAILYWNKYYSEGAVAQRISEFCGQVLTT